MKENDIPQHKPENDSIHTNFYITSKIIDWSLAKKNILWRPPTDVYETTDQFIVTIEIAGMNVKKIEIKYDNSTLSVQGKRNIRFECSTFHQIEINCGDFLSQVHFTTPINQNGINSKYNNGLLIINLPKTQ